ncbi:hypothetical protein [Streptomyces griseus]|uniref:hypothetical protein n=1 Tax=Streptomyces griseus TaxID=1911 RepID=UPI000AFF69C4|nr:hypothetical protein [Streptomyces griseus]
MPEQPEQEEAPVSPQPAVAAAPTPQPQKPDLSDDVFMMTEVGDEMEILPDQ